MSENKIMKGVEWFEENVHENREDLIKIAEQAKKHLHETLSIGVEKGESIIAMYHQVFETICNTLKDFESKCTDSEIDVASLFKIGFDTTENDDDEKQGNFMVYIRHMDNHNALALLDEDEKKTLNLCAMWNATNIKLNPEVMKDVASEALKAIESKLQMKLSNQEVVIPIFGVTHACIIEYVKAQRVGRKLSEFEVTVTDLYTVGCMINDDGEEEIYFDPSISMKLKFKNDALASSDE